MVTAQEMVRITHEAAQKQTSTDSHTQRVKVELEEKLSKMKLELTELRSAYKETQKKLSMQVPPHVPRPPPFSHLAAEALHPQRLTAGAAAVAPARLRIHELLVLSPAVAPSHV